MIHERLREAAQGTGIQFQFGGTIGNTLDSHRLLWLAAQLDKERGLEGNIEKGSQEKVIEQIFKTYFENNEGL